MTLVDRDPDSLEPYDKAAVTGSTLRLVALILQDEHDFTPRWRLLRRVRLAVEARMAARLYEMHVGEHVMALAVLRAEREERACGATRPTGRAGESDYCGLPKGHSGAHSFEEEGMGTEGKLTP